MKLPMLTNLAKGSRKVHDDSATRDFVEASSCSIPKQIACAGAVAACAAVCYASGGTACAACFSGLGMGSCIDCL